MGPEQRRTSANRFLILEDMTEDGTQSSGASVYQEAYGNPVPNRFTRWIYVLRSPKLQQPEKYVEGWYEDSQSEAGKEVESPAQAFQEDQQWDCLSAYSSQLGTVKTASLSAASQSGGRSRGTTQSTVNPSSSSESRKSNELDRTRTTTSPLSLGADAQARAIKRRQVIDEILKSEADYILGLKALINNVLSIPFLAARPEIYENVRAIREVHERYFAELQAVTKPKTAAARVELSNLESKGATQSSNGSALKNLQNRSLRTRKFKQDFNHRFGLVSADPAEALDVARATETLSAAFGVYVTFCSNYELLTHDMGLLSRSLPNWILLNQGIEALSKSVLPMESRQPEENKSMCASDLLIKPIQRLCKYKLLVEQLANFTPSSDCATANTEIRLAWDRVKSATTEVNSSTGNPVLLDRIQKTMDLEKILDLPVPVSPLFPSSEGKSFNIDKCVLWDVYRQLGPIVMCGVLHVTYQSADGLTGGYMVCVLFDQYFLLARLRDDGCMLETVACLYVWDLGIDVLRNGKGICCYGCIFSWKLVFQHDHHQYELVMSASTAAEERQWTSEILKSTEKVESVHCEPRENSFLAFDVQPLGHLPTSLARTISVHSVYTSSATNNAQHVRILNTHNPDSPVHLVEGEIERIKLSSPEGAVSLAPKRIDRMQLENFISGVYTSDVLPFPGMVLGPDEKRASRRLAKFNFPGNFKRRATLIGAGKVRSPNLIARSLSMRRKKPRRDVKSAVAHEVFPYDEEKQLVLVDDGSEYAAEQIQPPKTRTVSKESSTSTINQRSRSLGRAAGVQLKTTVGHLFHSLPMTKQRVLSSATQ